MSVNDATILALDTATEACSAALIIGGKVTTRYQLAPREHSRLILKMIDELLVEAGISADELDAIAFGRGPGSFMGLRIAAGVVQGIAFALDLPVIAISCLKSIALRAHEETGCTQVLSAIDARMDEVYWASYRLENGQWQLDGDECVVSPDKINTDDLLPEDAGSIAAAGSGWKSYKQRLLKTVNCQLKTFLPHCLPSAETIAKLAVAEFKAGNTIAVAEAVPVYIRNNVAKKPKPKVF
jgi:tRNA threonylcarbamoyladenosine biosynthesis protein TsaB